MNTTFKISPVADADNKNNIVIEIGASNIGIICYTTFPFVATGFYYYAITNKDTVAADLKAILHSENLNADNVADANIFYNYADTTLIPNAFFKVEQVNNIATLMFGNKSNATIANENIASMNIENIYAVPNVIKDMVAEIYPAAKNAHSVSKIVQSTNGTKLFATIYDAEIRVVLYKENEFMLAAYFDYTTPEDVCYHLLNVCERYEVKSTGVEIILNGLIDLNSNLYRELYKFFLNITMEQMPDKVMLADNFNGINEHYFSPLVKLAKCV